MCKEGMGYGTRVNIDFLKVVRLVFWSGVVGPFRSLALRARTIALRAHALTVALRAQKLDL